MKIKTDFVTNSSSASFILSVYTDEIKDVKESIDKLNRNPNSYEGVSCGFICENIKELTKYTSNRLYDWASKSRGVIFDRLSEEQFNTCKESINNKKIVIKVNVDNNVIEEFYDDWENNIIDNNIL